MKIIISALTALGDNVCATVAIGVIRKAYPAAEIAVLTWDTSEFVYKKCPYVDKVFVVDFSTKHYKRQWQFIYSIMKEHFDFAISLDNKTRSLLYMRLAGIRKIYLVGGMYGKVNFFKRYLLSDTLVMIDSKNQTVNVVEQYLDAMQAITGIRGERRTNLGTSSADELEYAKSLLYNAGYNGKQKLVALCIRDEKRLIKHWLGSQWAEVIKKLVEERDCFCFTVGVKSEIKYAQQVIEKSGVYAANLCGKTDIIQLMALLQSADVLIAPCSGTGHVAAALNVPAIIVYTNSRIYSWALPHDNFLPVFSFVDCLCYTDNNDCKDRKCCNEIDADDVVLAYDNLMQQVKSLG
ncbi:MAG: glycosyltransferase family 9 protein [Bacillota bacterium]